MEKNNTSTHRCEAEFIFNLEVNTIPSLAAADALEMEAINELKNIIADQRKNVSDIIVDVTAKTYDDAIDGIVAYKVTYSFMDNSIEDVAFNIGCDVADAFKRLGHTVKDWVVTANNTKPPKKHKSDAARERET